MRCGKHFWAAGLAAFLAGGFLSSAQTTNATPEFQEVYNLVRDHSGLDRAQLNDAALRGFLAALGPRVSLLTNGASAKTPAAPPVSESRIFEKDIAYFRVAHVGAGLAQTVSRTFQQWNATNRLAGVVLDLRYAGGEDYAAALRTAELFLSKARPLLNWGNGMVSSAENPRAIPVPVAVLVNHETAAAAEALAAVLRQTDTGLLLGSRTAGEAMIMKNYPLQNGDTLRIAVAPVTLGSGATLTTEGVKPDIIVPVSPQAERAFYANSYWVMPETNGLAGATNQMGGTNLVSHRIRINEAELVRAHKEGIDLEAEPEAAPPPPPERPVVTDPALARALDLLKGLAVVRQGR